MLKKKQKSVSDQLNELINPIPAHFDPEEDLYADSAAKVVENDYDEDLLEESTVSRYRQTNAELIEEVDERYLGKKVSRKSAIQSTNSEDGGNVSLEELSSDGEQEPLAGSSEARSESEDEFLEADGDEEGSDEDYEGEDDEDNKDNDNYDIVQGEDKESTFQHMSGSRGSEVEKGQAIRNQLGMWDQLLEARIRLQKCMSLANRLPQPGTLPFFKKEGGTDFVALLHETKQSTTNLLQKLLALRAERLKAFSETKNIHSSKKRKQSHTDDDNEEITSSEDDEEITEKEDEPSRKRIRPDDFASLLTEQHNEFTEYRNTTIQKWNDKTRVAVGNVNSRNFSAFEQSTLRQIEQILANRPRLVARTHLKRSNYRVLGKPSTVTLDKDVEEGEQRGLSGEELKSDLLEDKSKEHDSEIFDDDDFYHQLLRELIERKTVDVTDPVQLGRQWLELQKIRSKMKRKVDLRATKGRKLRFTVHQKLLNFMAPVMLCDWTEEAKTDLFNSLFGKTMESTGQFEIRQQQGSGATDLSDKSSVNT